ncbi:MAG: DNA repair protein RecN [Gemmataceae bacterium]
MLRELTVQNLALIEDVRVELESGFCAWSGETGAGKTLLLSALGLLLGERGNAELIRAGNEELRVVGRFELGRTELRVAVEQILDGHFEDNEVVLMRRLTKAGRSSAYVNEMPVSLSTLRQIGTVLVTIHGQRESHALLDPGYQLQLLDAFGGLGKYKAKYQKEAETFRAVRLKRSELMSTREQRQRELSLVRFEREELDNANLISGEKEELLQQRERLSNAFSLTEFAESACGTLYEDEGSIFELLGKVQRAAEEWNGIHEIKDLTDRLLGLSSDIQDIAATMRNLANDWEADPQRLAEVEDRLDLINKLEVKYQREVDALIAYHTELDEKEAFLQQAEDDLESVEEQLAAAYQKVQLAGQDLRTQRKKVAKKLVSTVQKHLADLGMKEARLEAVLEPVDLAESPDQAEVPVHGLEYLELMLAANKGEPARPLRKVASGGEMSRTMLALKSVLAAQDHVGTMIFDEIDSNVGGRLGDVVGEKLAALGQTHQVICVTHLPQVASYARNQWTIRKTKAGKRTTTTIERLDEPERLDELASMLRGESRGETTRQEVAAMLEAARAKW